MTHEKNLEKRNKLAKKGLREEDKFDNNTQEMLSALQKQLEEKKD